MGVERPRGDSWNLRWLHANIVGVWASSCSSSVVQFQEVQWMLIDRNGGNKDKQE